MLIVFSRRGCIAAWHELIRDRASASAPRVLLGPPLIFKTCRSLCTLTRGPFSLRILKLVSIWEVPLLEIGLLILIEVGGALHLASENSTAVSVGAFPSAAWPWTSILSFTIGAHRGVQVTEVLRLLPKLIGTEVRHAIGVAQVRVRLRGLIT